ncbi:MAG: hypothetical protein ACK5Y2_05050 [Bdellovibrionales bacterium]
MLAWLYMKFVQEKIFLIDGVGALVSAAFLGFVLPVLDIGLSTEVLGALAFVALIFAGYSLSCFYFRKNPRPWLAVIIAGNTLYALMTAWLVASDFDSLSFLGRLYFIGEIAVLVGMVYVELTVLRHFSKVAKASGR